MGPSVEERKKVKGFNALQFTTEKTLDLLDDGLNRGRSGETGDGTQDALASSAQCAGVQGGDDGGSSDSEIVNDVLERDKFIIVDQALLVGDRGDGRTNRGAKDVFELVDVDSVEGKGLINVALLVVAENGVSSSDSGTTSETTDDAVLENSSNVVGSLRENLAQGATNAGTSLKLRNFAPGRDIQHIV